MVPAGKSQSATPPNHCPQCSLPCAGGSTSRHAAASCLWLLQRCITCFACRAGWLTHETLSASDFTMSYYCAFWVGWVSAPSPAPNSVVFVCFLFLTDLFPKKVLHVVRALALVVVHVRTFSTRLFDKRRQHFVLQAKTKISTPMTVVGLGAGLLLANCVYWLLPTVGFPK
eukprot:TRINITY_DN4828_c0_g1_i3.p1 TRINITY_DN4828_c0_g1~~TRINITY_DN4828_c0_g1_i3.p1  ORF type:complete len:171 (-),score=18.54 TRINITY_DN4828_c0_g1_i3:304-816(-)